MATHGPESHCSVLLGLKPLLSCLWGEHHRLHRHLWTWTSTSLPHTPNTAFSSVLGRSRLASHHPPLDPSDWPQKPAHALSAKRLFDALPSIKLHLFLPARDSQMKHIQRKPFQTAPGSVLLHLLQLRLPKASKPSKLPKLNAAGAGVSLTDFQCNVSFAETDAGRCTSVC